MASFPDIKGLTDDEAWQALMSVMSVPGWPGVYVLGSFARYVTIYSQQVRALNLVDALCKSGLSRRQRVAVIGGGIAGATAAAAVAVSGARVTIFEKAPDLLSLQRNCQKRKVHPHIYDWPNIPADRRDPAKIGRAGLPLLDWSADEARNVVKEIDRQWQELRSNPDAGPLISVKLGHGVTGANLERTQAGTVTVHGEAFDVVILACGYGIEEEFDTISYWRDEDLEGHKGSCLVSGFGDGAVTDLMRLCIRNFYHGDVLDTFTSPSAEAAARQLLDAEQRYISGQDLSADYLKVARELGITTPARDDTKVVVNCTPAELFSPRSSVLNRLIVAHLLGRKAFAFHTQPGRIATERRLPEGGHEVTFEGREPEAYDHAILRHGVEKTSVLRHEFPAIWDATAEIRAAWKTTRQGTDWTRVPRYRDEDFRPAGPRRPTRVDFGGKIGCLVLDSGRTRKTGDDLVTLVKHALKRIKANSAFEGVHGIELEPEVIRLPDAMACGATYARTVRALCDSDLVVADISDFNPVAMLLLGIRAAVRRGVTVTVTHDPLFNDDDATARPQIPFNLLELNPLSLHGNDAKVLSNLQTSVTQGFTQYRALPDRYLDLPAYDAVRQLGASEDQYAPIAAGETILMLSWFSPHYMGACGQTLLNAIDTEFGPGKAVRTIDASSPQLVGQRLYALIRRTNLCVADWTAWRPNVLFETGVRLAVNEVDPVLVTFDTAAPAAFKLKGADAEQFTRRQRDGAALTSLFAPHRYDKTGPGIDRLAGRLEAVRLAPNHAAPNQGAKLSPGFTYRLVRDERVDSSAAAGVLPVHRLLSETADAMIGSPLGGTVPYLYAAGNAKLLANVRREAIERLLAAVYYLERRHSVLERVKANTISGSDSLVLEYADLVGRTLDTIRNHPGRAYDAVRAELDDVLSAVDALPRSAT